MGRDDVPIDPGVDDPAYPSSIFNGRRISSMGGRDAVATDGATTGAGAPWRRRRRKMRIAIAARESTDTPPTAPPTIGPVLFGLLGEGEKVGTVEEVLVWVPDVVTEAPEEPSMAPGAASGESPTFIALLESQVMSDVTSMRAHLGTRVSAGTGLGNDEGGRIFTQ